MFPEKNLPTRPLKYCQFTVTFLFYHSYPYGLPVGSMYKENTLEETRVFCRLTWFVHPSLDSASCLCLKKAKHPNQILSILQGGQGGIITKQGDRDYPVQCFPLYSLILAVGNRTINYLSLDIEGAEFQV
jgi:hypothetical protein